MRDLGKDIFFLARLQGTNLVTLEQWVGTRDCATERVKATASE